jgi:CheY-like chemotaxis protein
MRILLVEDDDNKGEQIRQFAEVLKGVTSVKLERSLQSGLRRLKQEPFDLLLLDMTLPTYDAGPEEPGGGSTLAFGGKRFLQQMDRFDVLVPVVVVTQFESFQGANGTIDINELDTQLRTQHPNMYKGIVYYHPTIHDWREKLQSFIGSTDEVSL